MIAKSTRNALLMAAATGVLAHLQHVLMYSTTRIPEPIAKRTRQVQGDVQDIMRRLLCLSVFWHALDIIWVAIFTIVYLIGTLP